MSVSKNQNDNLRKAASKAGLADVDWYMQNKAKEWPPRLNCDRVAGVRIAVAVIDWVLPNWQKRRPSDTAPERAVDAARLHPIALSENWRKHARALARACTAARERSLGYEHHIAEAARAIATATAAISDSAALAAVGESLQQVEEHVVYQYSVIAEYGKEPVVRAEMLCRALTALPERATPES